MNFYFVVFITTLSISFIFTLTNYSSAVIDKNDQKLFQRQYLIVHTLAYFADWLKGPYIYALYNSYGLSENDIALLFLVGFGVSGIFGPFVGMFADKYGRKKLSLAYFIIYILSALCQPFVNFKILILGRILGGIGTSLLTSTFESWMIAEHKRREFPQELLDDTFSKSTLCNSVSAIVAGIVAQLSSEYFGYIAPFMLAINPLMLGMFFCWQWWKDDTVKTPTVQHLVLDKNMTIIGFSQSLFLGGMYIFVFLWTPALGTKNIPFGLIFATFMVMISIGSGIFKVTAVQTEQLPYVIFFLSILATIVTISSLHNEYMVFTSFLVFELACGIMFPTYGSLRATYIPDEYRTTVMNIYRIPLNMFVIIVLLINKYISLEVSFCICLAAYITCYFSWYAFTPKKKIHDGHKYEMSITEEDKESDVDDYELESDEEFF